MKSFRFIFCFFLFINIQNSLSQELAGIEVELLPSLFKKIVDYFDIDKYAKEYQKRKKASLVDLLSEKDLDDWAKKAQAIYQKNNKQIPFDLKSWSQYTFEQKKAFVEFDYLTPELKAKVIIEGHIPRDNSSLVLKNNAPDEFKDLMSRMSWSRDQDTFEFRHKLPLESIDDAIADFHRLAKWVDINEKELYAFCHLHISIKGKNLINQARVISLIKTLEMLKSENDPAKSILLKEEVMSYNEITRKGVLRANYDDDPSHFEIRILNDPIDEDVRHIKDWIYRPSTLHEKLASVIQENFKEFDLLFNSSKTEILQNDLFEMLKDPKLRVVIIDTFKKMGEKLQSKDFIIFLWNNKHQLGDALFNEMLNKANSKMKLAIALSTLESEDIDLFQKVVVGLTKDDLKTFEKLKMSLLNHHGLPIKIWEKKVKSHLKRAELDKLLNFKQFKFMALTYTPEKLDHDNLKTIIKKVFLEFNNNYEKNIPLRKNVRDMLINKADQLIKADYFIGMVEDWMATLFELDASNGSYKLKKLDDLDYFQIFARYFKSTKELSEDSIKILKNLEPIEFIRLMKTYSDVKDLELRDWVFEIAKLKDSSKELIDFTKNKSPADLVWVAKLWGGQFPELDIVLRSKNIVEINNILDLKLISSCSGAIKAIHTADDSLDKVK